MITNFWATIVGKKKGGTLRLYTTQFLTGSVCTVASAMESVHSKMCSKRPTPASCAVCLINPTSVVPLPGFGPGEDTLGERQGCHYITSGLPPLGCGLNVGIKATLTEWHEPGPVWPLNSVDRHHIYCVVVLHI